MPIPEDGGKWGILGGMFDPVHFGHLTLAQDIKSELSLDGILLTPSARHPFKKQGPVASFTQRVAMLKAICDLEPLFQINQIEAEQDLSGYTVDTVKALKQQYPQTHFYYIIGADNLEQFIHWRQPEEILNHAKLVVGARPGFNQDLMSELPPDRIIIVESSLVDVSSSMIRKQISNGVNDLTLKQWIPGGVINYIRQEGLYQ